MATPDASLAWPAGEKGTVLLDVVLDKPVDEVFMLLFCGENELRRKFNAAAGNKEYRSTGWLADPGELEAALASGGPAPAQASVTALKAGMVRKSTYTGVSMGSKYRTNELYRLVEAASGSAYELQVTVATTATYGDKFRPLVRHTLRALEDGGGKGGGARSALQTRASLVFVAKVNGFIKGMIEKGVRDGMQKNFATYKQTIGEFVGVSEPAAVAVPPVAAAAAAAEPVAAEAAEAAVPAGLLESLAGRELVARLDPWAAFLSARLAGLVPPPLALLAEQGTLLVLLAGGLLLLGMRLVVDVLRFMRHAGDNPQDSIALLAHLAFRLVDVPDSTQEMVTACLLVYLVRVLANRLAGVLPPPPPSAGSGGGAEGSPEPRSPDTPAVARNKSEEAEAEGIKYEGYAEAIAGMQNGLGKATAPLPSRNDAQDFDEAMAAETKRALQQIKSSITGVGKLMRPSQPKPIVSARDAAAAEAEAAAALLGERHTRARLRKHRKGRKGRHEDGGGPEEPDTTPLQTAALAAASHTSGTPRSGTPTSYLSEGESEAGDGGDPATPREKSGSGPASPLAGPSGSGSAVQPLSPSMSFTARLFGGMTLASGSAGKAAAPSSPPRRPASPRAGAPGHDALGSPGSDARGHQGAFFPVHLPPELAGHAVVEEVFENQRLQPFRGWGHTWPGHFLPTDKVSHWTAREVQCDDGRLVVPASSQSFSDVEPRPPEGWSWVEDTWHLDVSGLVNSSMDNEGWSYGLDFGYVVHPFIPGNGKKKLSDFVRRRRWVRTRVPTDVYERFASAAAAAAGPTPGASAPGTGPASVAGSASAEAVAAVFALREAAGAKLLTEAAGSGLGPTQERMQDEVAGVMEGMLAGLAAGEAAAVAAPLDGGALHADEAVLAARLATAAVQAQAATEQQQQPHAGAEVGGNDGKDADAPGGRSRLELCSAATLRPRGPLSIEESLPLEPGASDYVTFSPNASLAPPQQAGEGRAAAGPPERAARATTRATSAAGSGGLATTTAAVPDAGHLFGSSSGSGVIIDSPEAERGEESQPAAAAAAPAVAPPAAEPASALPAAAPSTRPLLVRRSAETPPVLGLLATALVEKEARKPLYQSD